MKEFLTRLLILIFGLFIFSAGIVLTINANIGYAPWDVFHVGLSYAAGMSIGTASIITGLVIVAFVVLCGEKIGIGMILNAVLIGVFIDLIMGSGLIPVADHFFISMAMLIFGLFTLSVGSYLYIKSAFGAGPRDSLMVLARRKTNLPVGVCRSAVELSATLVGWLLGGMVGIGTVIIIVSIGFCIQITFAVFKFDVAAVKHETLKDTIDFIVKAKV